MTYQITIESKSSGKKKKTMSRASKANCTYKRHQRKAHYNYSRTALEHNHSYSKSRPDVLKAILIQSINDLVYLPLVKLLRLSLALPLHFQYI